MQVFQDKKKLQDYLESLSPQALVGFVPTMGALHEGHLSLFQQSIEDNDVTVASIFVNPTQFNNQEDFDQYPNTLQKDQSHLERIGVDLLFIPNVEEMYPNGLETEPINLHGMDKVMEGKFRPGHFEGMATVVKRLLEIVKPNQAYFGEKDFQQLQIIRRMVSEYSIPVEIIGMPIIREPNGLAMSSRNMRLTDHQKEEATVIYQTLKEIQEQSNKLSVKELKHIGYRNFAFSNLQLEYLEIVKSSDLHSVEVLEKSKEYRACIAAYCGDVRLIDNIELL